MVTHQTLGVMLLMQGNAEGALPHLEKTRTPELLGLAYLETGRLAARSWRCRRALEKQPDDPDLLYYFGRAYGVGFETDSRSGLRNQPRIGAQGAAPRVMRRVTRRITRSRTRLKTWWNSKRRSQSSPNDADLLLAFSRAAASGFKQAFDQILADPNRTRHGRIRS